MATKRNRAGDETESWLKCRSKTTGRDFWYNVESEQSRWTDPSLESDGQWSQCYTRSVNAFYWYNDITNASLWNPPSREESRAAAEDRYAQLEGDYSRLSRVDEPDCPRLVDSPKFDAARLVARLRNERARGSVSQGYKQVFTLPDDDVGGLTRALQEDEILKTRLKLWKREQNKAVDLPSFWEVWRRGGEMRAQLLAAADPHEAKWALQKQHGYKLATTFMPGYAKAVYEHFGAQAVLDPCAGWGDRMLGAMGSDCVRRYVAFDPNRSLRRGYASIMRLFGDHGAVAGLTEDSVRFSNSFQVRSLPFEAGAAALRDCSFDLVFTSPPFFDYEMYNPDNPDYKDWIEEFYVPLMRQACRCVKPGKFVCIHIGDTSAGQIVPFLKNRVHQITSLKLVYNLGLMGVMSEKIRDVWVFQKALVPSPSRGVVSAAAAARHSLNVERIRAATNPPLHVAAVRDPRNGREYRVIDDGHVCVGGTKQRLLGRIIRHIPAGELVYAGPDGGIAQVALAFAARLWGRRATIFLNTSIGKKEKPPLVRLAEELGAAVHLTDSLTGRSLADTQADARRYCEDNSERYLLPFGLKSSRGELYFDLFREAILEAIPAGMSAPRRLWLVGGSGFLFDVLSSIWPETLLLIVQVGKRIWPDQLEGKRCKLFVAPEHFSDTALRQPPYATVPWYDAKLWQFVEEHGETGDYIWNVGKVTAHPPS